MEMCLLMYRRRSRLIVRDGSALYYNSVMKIRLPLLLALLTICGLTSLTTGTVVADETAKLNGSWVLDEDNSETLDEKMAELKQEYRDYQSEHGGINDPDKPDPFGKRRFGDKEWESRRSGPVPPASSNTRLMLQCEALKLYVSERIIIAYGGEIKRRLNPNPAGRVYSATGKGVSKDSFGQTLAYLEDGGFVIDTRTKSAERLVERFKLEADGQLKLSVTVKNPEWRRAIDLVRYYVRAPSS